MAADWSLAVSPWVETMRTALDRWWTTWVPVVLPGYAAARLATTGWPWPWAAAATSVLTFSAAGVVPALSAAARGELSRGEAETCFIWGNLNNPWLDAAPGRVWIAVTLATVVVGLLRTVSARSFTRRSPPDVTDWAGWVGEAMNWAAVLGLITLVGALGAAAAGPAWWAACLDPLTNPTPSAALHAGLLAMGGLFLLLPELAAARTAGLRVARLLAWRLLQAGMAAALAAWLVA